jgi:hypothetical protein
MKRSTSFALFVAISMGLVANTLAFTSQYYQDTSCKNKVTSPFAGAPSPLVTPTNGCTLSYNVSTLSYNVSNTIFYTKVITCPSTGSATIENYLDKACTTGKIPYTYAVGTCLSNSTAMMPDGAGSLLISCDKVSSSASAASVAFIATMIALLLFVA